MYYEEMQKKVEELKKKYIVRILAIESSCDETSISVVINGREMLSNVIASQIEIHKQFGGVVPEVASRNHIQNITNCYKEALAKANITEKEMEAINANAINSTKLKSILNNADLDSLKKLTTPDKRKGLTDSQLARAKAMLASGYYTQADVAEQFGISPTTLRSSAFVYSLPNNFAIFYASS